MSIFMILLFIYLGLNIISSFYQAGAYANGKRSTLEGKEAVGRFALKAVIFGLIFVGLWLGW